MSKKYELTDDTIQHDGRTLHRIRALVDIPAMQVSAGDLGGYVESEKNLSHDGGAWVDDNARVYGHSRVYGNAHVYGNAWVGGNACVFGEACVFGGACVYGGAIQVSHIPYQIARQKHPTDNGLLERIERDGSNHSLYAVLALISRTADILEKNDTLNERVEDESWIAFDALDKLRGRLSTILYEDEAGITADNRRRNEINDYNDMRRAEAIGK